MSNNSKTQVCPLRGELVVFSACRFEDMTSAGSTIFCPMTEVSQLTKDMLQWVETFHCSTGVWKSHLQQVTPPTTQFCQLLLSYAVNLMRAVLVAYSLRNAGGKRGSSFTVGPHPTPLIVCLKYSIARTLLLIVQGQWMTFSFQRIIACFVCLSVSFFCLSAHLSVSVSVCQYIYYHKLGLLQDIQSRPKQQLHIQSTWSLYLLCRLLCHCWKFQAATELELWGLLKLSTHHNNNISFTFHFFSWWFWRCYIRLFSLCFPLCCRLRLLRFSL